MSDIKVVAHKWSARKISKAAARGEKAVIESAMRVDLDFCFGRLNKVRIRIKGDLSRIPSLKNSRHPKFPGIDGVVRAKLKALDILWNQEIAGYANSFSGLSFGDRRVFLCVSFAKQTRSFDEDNATTTIKDWLEPKTKIVGGKARKNRGWGIGLVNNDSQIVAVGAKSSDIGFEGKDTEIIIVPFDEMKNQFSSLFNFAFLKKEEA